MNTEPDLYLSTHLYCNGVIGNDGSVLTKTTTGQSWKLPYLITYYGSYYVVDALIGDNATAQMGKGFYSTIQAALNIANSAGGGYIVVNPGTYTGPFVINNNITVEGVSEQVVTLQNINVTASTDLVTIYDNCRLENISLRLRSNTHVNLRGIVLMNNAVSTSQIRNLSLVVENLAANNSGTSNIYGIHIGNSIGSAPLDSFQAVRACNINVGSIGNGNKRALLNDSNSTIRIRDSNFYLVCDNLIAGNTGTYYAVEQNNAASTTEIRSSSIEGKSALMQNKMEDVSNTAGSLYLGYTNLVFSRCNGLSFNSILVSPRLVWSDPGTLGFSGTRCMRFGTSNATTTVAAILITRKCVFKKLNVAANIAPGSTRSAIFTLIKFTLVNGSYVSTNTSLAATLTGTDTSVSNNINAVTFQQNDKVALYVTSDSTLSSLSDVVVTVNMY